MDSGHVRYSVSNGIGTIVFYHPQSNSLPGTLLQELGDVIQHAGKDSDSQVLILRSEGEKAFCAGASFDELVAIQDLLVVINFSVGSLMLFCPCVLARSSSSAESTTKRLAVVWD